MGDDDQRTIEALRVRIAELEASNTRLTEFAHTISHDLRAPLHTISGFVDLMAELEDTLPVDARRYLSFIRAGTARMDDMIAGLLQFTQVGRSETTRRALDLAWVLSEVGAALRQTIDEAEGAIQIEGPLPRVVGVRSEVRSLFQNLIENSMKYRAPSRAPRVHIRGERRGDRVRFELTDNGIGIPPQEHSQIFKLFQRLPGSDKHGEGSGIGLSICKRIVESEGGQLTVASDGRTGTTFAFTLPAPVEAHAERGDGLSGSGQPEPDRED